MRVLHVTRDFPPRRTGGVSTAVGGLVAHLIERGVECAVVSFDGWRPRSRAAASSGAAREEAIGGAAVLRVSEPGHLDAARGLAAAFEPDVVHVHHGMLWELGDELRRTHRAAAVVTAHTAQRHQNRLRGISDRTMSLAGQERALSEADLVLAPSRRAAEILGADHPGLDGRLRVARLGVDDGLAARAGARPARPESGPIAYVGRFSDLSGIAELFDALPRVLEEVPDARFVVAGGNPEGRRSEARWRRRFDRETAPAVRDRVRFAGWLEPEELATLYAEASVLVSPSWFETFGLVVLEGMLFGAPIAATRSGGVEELIDHDRSGLLSPPRDPEALAGNVVKLCRDRRRAARLGAEAARTVRRRHTWQRRVGETLDAYREL